MPSFNYPSNAPAPTPPREPRSLYHPQPQFFTGAGENLTFEIAGGAACSLPRVHLIYAECQGCRLRFGFPLHQVEVVNLPTRDSVELLDALLNGEVSILYAGHPWATEAPAHARPVATIEITSPFDPPQPESRA